MRIERQSSTGTVLGIALAIGVSTGAQAQQYWNLAAEDFTSDAWIVTGDAGKGHDVIGDLKHTFLSLTQPGSGSQQGAAFTRDPVLVNFNQPFTYEFRFFVPPGEIVQGDGLTFFIAGYDPLAAGLPLSGGSDLGYGGSPVGSYAFAIDTFHFEGEPVSTSIQILRDGDAFSPLAHTETGVSNIRDPNFFQWTAQLAFTPSGNDDETGQLTGTIEQFVGSQTYTVSYGVEWYDVGLPQYVEGDLVGRLVHIGFTASNGLADDGHFISSTLPIPEPGTWAMLLAGLGVVGMRVARRRRA